MKEAAPKAEFFAPIEPEDPWIGRVLRFETTDLDGNPVRSDELFAEHDITMLNFWATWCGPCKRELRELGDIDRRMQEENCAIVGILSDADDEGAVETGKALLEENGVDYLNLKMPEALVESEIAVSLPTSVFVDSSGVIIAPVITGAFIHIYETRFRGLLDGAEPAAADAGADAAALE
jgi:thiol-disulfide isomerase/thioredoxin